MSSLVSFDQPGTFFEMLITQTGATYLQVLWVLAESLAYHNVREVYNPKHILFLSSSLFLSPSTSNF